MIGSRSDLKLRVTGLYSDMRFNKEGGDILGMEVIIICTRDGYKAVVQIAEGVPEAPVVVSATIKGSAVSFVIPPSLKFSGQVARDSLSGTLGVDRVSLRRGKSYWQ